MAVTPDTYVKLLKVPLELDNKNQLTFSNATAQYTYFNNLSGLVSNDFTYQRKDSIIRFPAHIDSLLGYNYCMYQNSHYTNKWFYCFITNMRYINDGMTEITIKTDVFQTWQFDLTYKRCFVEREHTNDDTIGSNLVEEGLELGEYISNGLHYSATLEDILQDCCYIMGLTVSTILDNGSYPPVGGGVYNGIYSGVRYYRYDSVNAIDTVLELLANAGQSDAVTGIFIAPKFLAVLDEQSTERIVENSNYPYAFSYNTQKSYGLDGYSPRNNKLKTYPFCYLLASNNSGGSAIYRYEDFSSNVCGFVWHGALCPGCSIRMNPTNYKGLSVNDEEGLNLGKFPICNYAVDMYTNWLTQNSVNIEVSEASAGLQILGGMITTAGGDLGGASQMTSGLMSIAGLLGEKYKASLVPPQARGNLNCGDVIASQSKINFYFYNMSIKAEKARIIDDFFSMFGYKTNRVKVPNVTGRTNWNYVKTVDSIITGDVPQEDLQEIKNMFDDGVTFWHKTSTFLDYSQSNAIV